MGSHDFSQHYSETTFLDKLMKYAKTAGLKVIYTALLLFYALQSPRVPTKARAIIVGALGYFIFPFDIIPDIMPGLGYTDDLGILLAALVAVAIHIDEEIKAKALRKLRSLFGDNLDNYDIKEIDEKLKMDEL